MDSSSFLFWALALAPAALMSASAGLACIRNVHTSTAWKVFRCLSALALLFALLNLVLLWAMPAQDPGAASAAAPKWLAVSLLGAWVAALVQLLGTVIGTFSSRYLQGEPAQTRYVGAFSAVLTAVHLLLLANHWVILVAAWAAVGLVLQRLLCFYPNRPFALLAAHKKRIADRLADLLLIAAAALVWRDLGSLYLSDLWLHLAQGSVSLSLQLSAVCLTLAVILRSAQLPVHGWLIQVMEAPTPVSALLHAGVVNLGGFILIRFAPLLEAAPAARWLLVGCGLMTAFLAGMVMLTRISIKVRLAWSTVAQMGFMLLECGLGLYTLAALHLIGHSLYKAHTFLAASSAVEQSKQKMMRATASAAPLSLIAAPWLSILIVMLVQSAMGNPWPWWWSSVLALAWAPLLWLPSEPANRIQSLTRHGLAGCCMTIGLTALASTAHALPFGLNDAPDHAAGLITLIGMLLMYLCLALLQWRPQTLTIFRRWSYAGFYLDELATRMALTLWPTRWMPVSPRGTQSALNNQSAVTGSN